MPPRKSKKSSIEIKSAVLTRQPLYSEEKENMESSSISSEDSPEKSPNSNSPITARKSNSSSSSDSMQNMAGSPKRRSLGNVQNQMNEAQEMANSDEDMEIESQSYADHLYNQRQNLAPKDGLNYSADLRNRRSNQLKAQSLTTEPSIESPNSNIAKIIVPCILILVIITLIILRRNTGAPSMNDQFNATTLMNSLRAEFQDQPQLTFRIIHGALKSIQAPQPEAPAIILLLATNGSENNCTKFARRLVNLLSVSQNSLQIHGKDYKLTNTNSAKMKIDKDIENALKTIDQLGTVLIEGVDQIPGRAAVMLHKYYDHENAPFKRAVFVMTANYNKAIRANSDAKEWDKAANDHLLSVWTDIGVDQVTPLLARLTVSVAVITA